MKERRKKGKDVAVVIWNFGMQWVLQMHGRKVDAELW